MHTPAGVKASGMPKSSGRFKWGHNTLTVNMLVNRLADRSGKALGPNAPFWHDRTVECADSADGHCCRRVRGLTPVWEGWCLFGEAMRSGTGAFYSPHTRLGWRRTHTTPG